jgi:hypothetical protein
MLARIIYPVEAEQVVSLRKYMVYDDLHETYKQKSVDIHKKYPDPISNSNLVYKYFTRMRALPKDQIPPEYHVVIPLAEELTALIKDTEQQIRNETGRIEQNHKNKMKRQNTIAMTISRLSPACCYSYLISGLSHTGSGEYDRFIENAREFQDLVKKTIYDCFYRRIYAGGWEEFALRKAPETLPDLQYRYLGLREILGAGLVDVILSVGFTFLFFALAFVAFNKYDVRP